MSLAERLMRHRGTNTRKVHASDGQGGWTTDYAPIATDVPYKLDPSSRAEQVVGEQERAELGMRLFVPVETDIARGDRFITEDDRTVEIRTVEPTGGVAFTAAGGQLRCIVEHVQHGVAEHTEDS